MQLMQAYFNTSHVNVNPVPPTNITARSGISIHLMLMLIGYTSFYYFRGF